MTWCASWHTTAASLPPALSPDTPSLLPLEPPTNKHVPSHTVKALTQMKQSRLFSYFHFLLTVLRRWFWCCSHLYGFVVPNQRASSRIFYLSNVTRKHVFGVCDQVRLKLACSAIETSQRLEILHLETTDIILSKQRNNKGADHTARVRRLICAFVVRIWQKQVFSWRGSIFSSYLALWSDQSGKRKLVAWLVIYVYVQIWAAAWQNQENDLCAQRRLRSAFASAQSDQSLRCSHEETSGP